MLAAFLTTVFFSISVICAGRSAKMIGGTEANFWRLTFATFFLSLWAFTCGQGISGESFSTFVLSGLIGIGIGDVALFQTLPRLGSRLSLLLVQCLTAPFGAAIEWLWLGTKLSVMEIICGGVILLGIGISLAPEKRPVTERNQIFSGVLFSLLAAAMGGWGAVLSRKAYGILERTGETVDGATAAFQRLLGGLFIGAICLLIVKWRAVEWGFKRSPNSTRLSSKEKWRRTGPWILANALAGQTIGVTFYQRAFQTTPTGIVLPIVATAPLVAIPFVWLIEKERPTRRSLAGGIVAVAGVIGLALFREHAN